MKKLFIVIFLVLLIIASCDPMYVIKFGKKSYIKPHTNKFINDDSTIVKAISVIDEIKYKFNLGNIMDYYNYRMNENYYSFRLYFNDNPNLQSSFYLQVSYFYNDSLFVIELSDFPSSEQSTISKEIEIFINSRFDSLSISNEIVRLDINNKNF